MSTPATSNSYGAEVSDTVSSLKRDLWSKRTTSRSDVENRIRLDRQLDGVRMGLYDAVGSTTAYEYGTVTSRRREALAELTLMEEALVVLLSRCCGSEQGSRSSGYEVPRPRLSAVRGAASSHMMGVSTSSTSFNPILNLSPSVSARRQL
eukprot:PhM_4_TR12513/c0_g1_i1/m.14177